MDTIQSAVEALTRLGVVTIPVRAGTKEPVCKWERLARSPEDGDAHESNAKRCEGADALAILLGPCSGSLAARDFDTRESYQAWSVQNVELACSLPTVTTVRGAHVYFRASPELSNGTTVKKYADGELRVSRCYVLVPPSPHPDGGVYTWKVPLGDELPSVIDPHAVGLVPRFTEQTEHTEHTKHTEHTEVIKRGRDGSRATLSTDPTEHTEEIRAAIEQAIPAGHGQRNRLIFDFVRELRVFLDPDTPMRTLRPFVEEWHMRALPNIQTKDFETTWVDFGQAWTACHTPANQDVLALSMADADALTPPPGLVDLYHDAPTARRLGATCYHLARRLGEDWQFNMPTRNAGRIIGQSHTRGHTLLRVLVLDGFLAEVAKGEAKPGGKATRFRYIGDRLPEHADT